MQSPLELQDQPSAFLCFEKKMIILNLHFPHHFHLNAGALVAPTPSQDQAKSVIPASLNLAVPGSPALDILGISASKATQPSSLQQVAWSLLNAYDASGKVQQGVAYTATPVDLKALPSQVDLAAYWSPANFLMRAKYRTRFSLGLAKGADDPQGISKGAFGISVPFIDHTDWRTEPDLMQKYSAEVLSKPLLILPEFPTYTEETPALVVVIALQTQRSELTRLTVLNVSQMPTAPYHFPLNQRIHVVNGKTYRFDGKDFVEIADQKGTELETKAEAAIKAIGDLLDPSPGKDWSAHPPVDSTNANRTDHAAILLYEARRPALKEVKDLADQATISRQKEVDALTPKYNAMAWNRLKFDFAAAGFSQAEGGSAFKSGGFGAWSSLAMPVGAAQGTVYLKYVNRLFEKIGDMTTAADLTGWTAAARIRGGGSQDGYFAEYEYQQAKPSSGGASVFSHVFQLGWEHKLGDQWIQLGIGKDLQNSHKFIFGLNFAFDTSTSRSLDIPGKTAS